MAPLAVPESSSVRIIAVQKYVRVAKSHNLYSVPEQKSINYTDGESFERHLYESVRNASDRSTFSKELPSLIVDWPSEYHLSRARHCLLRPLKIEQGAKVLELGCGCGAITRYLGELGAATTAVEGSMRRALIADERCRGLSNVKIIVDDLSHFESEESFDWILLVGVLEYAPVFSAGSDPAGHYLRQAKRFLKPDGRLVVAIENKLGLKYFNGCTEDHLGTVFTGVQGLYKPHGPRTFGRLELEHIIRSVGHSHVAFYYPFPDYKLPRVILPQAALRDRTVELADFLLGIYSRDYARNAQYLFDEPMVWRQVIDNGLLEHLANSFLVISANHDLVVDQNELAFFFNCQRAAEFATQTRLVRAERGIRVIKERLCPDLPRAEHILMGKRFEHLVGESDFVAGPLALGALSYLRASDAVTDEIVSALMPWFDALIDRSDESKRGASKPTRLSEFTVPGHMVDATPFNMVAVKDRLTEIDIEWKFETNIPLGWVVTRSLFHTLVAMPGMEAEPIPIADVVSAIAVRRGLEVSTDEIAHWLSYEREFLSVVLQQKFPLPIQVNAKSTPLITLHHVVDKLRRESNSLNGALAESDETIQALRQTLAHRDAVLLERDQALSQRDNEISAIRHALTMLQQSTSWKITAPLRKLKEFIAALGSGRLRRPEHPDQRRK